MVTLTFDHLTAQVLDMWHFTGTIIFTKAGDHTATCP